MDAWPKPCAILVDDGQDAPGPIAAYPRGQGAAALHAAPVSAAPRGYRTEFWVRTGTKRTCVPVERIERIEAAKDHAILHTSKQTFMIHVAMDALIEALDPRIMVRVHRSTIVRAAAVRRIHVVGRHMMVVMPSGAAVRVGPRHWEEVRLRLSG